MVALDDDSCEASLVDLEDLRTPAEHLPSAGWKPTHYLERPMKFFLTSLPDENAPQAPPTPEFMAEMARFVESETKAGVLVATGATLPISMGGARVRSSKGKFTVIDGPFTESKELIAGWAIVEVSSRDEAIEASRRFFAVAGDGIGEIRRIMGPSDRFPGA